VLSTVFLPSDAIVKAVEEALSSIPVEVKLVNVPVPVMFEKEPLANVSFVTDPVGGLIVPTAFA
jgi:hypothetical protein